jgi:hypothetical protein
MNDPSRRISTSAHPPEVSRHQANVGGRFVERFRATHGRKTNLMRRVDSKGW